MKAGQYFNGWVIASVLLVAAITAGGCIIWLRWDRGQVIEIALSPERELAGYIRIDGEVNNPGIYPLDAGHNIEELLRMAGGVTGGANRSSFTLHVPSQVKTQSPQKVNINLADDWLLEALPGIGETKARAIIKYRQQNGFFRNTGELVRVEGIGEALYEEIKHLITISD